MVILSYILISDKQLIFNQVYPVQGFQGDTVVKNLPASAGDARDTGLIPIPWRRKR